MGSPPHQFLGNSGIGQPALQNALHSAYTESISDLEQEWKTRAPRSQDGAIGFFQTLRDEASEVFAEATGDGLANDSMLLGNLRSGTTHLGSLSRQYLESRLQQQNEGLKDLVVKALIPKTTECFLRIIQTDSQATNPAWRALQLLAELRTQTTLSAIANSTEIQEHQLRLISDALARLEAWKEQLEALPIDAREPTGQDSLAVLLEVSTQSVVRAIDDATASIQATVRDESRHIQKRIDGIEDLIGKLAENGAIDAGSDTENVISVGTSEPPFGHVHLFGRSTEHDTIVSTVKQRRSVLITGLPGIGKSVLAAAVARGPRDSEAVKGFIWVEIAGATNIESICDSIAGFLGIPGIVGLPSSHKAAAVRNELSKRLDYLLILDNIPTPRIAMELVNRYVPKEMMVVATSKRKLFVFSKTLELTPLQSDAAVALFQSRIGSDLTVVVHDAQAVCRLLERHPLAIEVAAGRLRLEHMPIGELLDRLSNEKTRLQSLRVAGSEDPSLNIAATFALSWEALNPLPKKLLAALAHTRHRTSLALVSDSIEVDYLACSDAAGDLVERCLIGRTGDYLGMHQLLKDFVKAEVVQDRVSIEFSIESAIARYIREFLEHPDDSEYQEKLELDIQNVGEFVLRLLSSGDKVIKEAGIAFGCVLIEYASVLRRRNLTTLRKKLVQALVGASKHNVSDELYIDISLSCAPILVSEGLRDEAMQLIHEAREKATRLEGDKSRQAGLEIALGNLAMEMGVEVQAYGCFLRAQQQARSIGDKVGLASALGQMGSLALQRGVLAPAFRLYSQALSLYDETGHSQGTAACEHYLAEMKGRLGYLDESIEHFWRSLKIEQELGNLPGVVVTYESMITHVDDESLFSAAFQTYESMLKEFRYQGNRDGEASLLGSMGFLEYRRSNWDQARNLYQESLELHRSLDNSSEIAVCLGQLGVIAYESKQYSVSRGHVLTAFDEYNKLHDEDGIARCRFQLGLLDILDRQWESARDNFLQCLKLSYRTDPLRTYQAMIRVGRIRNILNTEDPREKQVHIDREIALTMQNSESENSVECESKSMGDTASSLDSELEKRLAHSLPAIRAARGYVEVTSRLQSEYLDALKRRSEFLLSDHSPKLPNLALTHAAFDFGLRWLAENEPSTAELLLLLAVLPNVMVSNDDLLILLPEHGEQSVRSEQIVRQLTLLERLGLIEFDQDGVRIMFDAKCRVLGLSTKDDRMFLLRSAFVGLSRALESSGNVQSLAEIPSSFLSCILTLAAHARIADVDITETLNLEHLAAGMLRDHGAAVAAMLIYDDALDLAENLYGIDSTKCLRSLNNAASCLAQVLQLPEFGEKLFERALQIVSVNEFESSEELDNVGKILSNYAHIFLESDRLDEAWNYFEEARRIHTWLHGTDHVTTAIDINNLALMHAARSEWIDARKLLEDAASTFRECDGEMTPAYANILLHQARVLNQLGDNNAAVSLAERAVEIREQVLGIPHADVAEAYFTKGQYLEEADRGVDAKESVSHALYIAEIVYGPNDYATLRIKGYLDSL